MINNLLALINRKNEKYINWKKTPTTSPEYEIKKTNFKTFDKIVNRQKMKQKSITSRESVGEIKII